MFKVVRSSLSNLISWAIMQSHSSRCTYKKCIVFYIDDTKPLNSFLAVIILHQGFPDSSVDKESACNAGDPSSIPGSGTRPGEGIGYSLQYSWASLMAQLVKNPPAMQETWV